MKKILYLFLVCVGYFTLSGCEAVSKQLGTSNPASSTPTANTKTITAFYFVQPSVNGTISEIDHTIRLTVASGTAISALAPNITHTGAQISPASGVTQNFTTPIVYRVTASDGTSQNYTVTVTITRPQPAIAIAGYYNDGTKNIACYWLDTTRIDLPGDGIHDAAAKSITVVDNIVYTCGYYNDGTKNIPCYWVGTVRTDLPSDGASDAMANAIALYNGTVYTCGYYASTIPCYWTGTTRTKLPCSDGTYLGAATTIAVENGSVYTGGWTMCTRTFFDPSYNKWKSRYSKQACYWTFNTVHDQDSDSNWQSSSVNGIAANNGNVFTSGYFIDKASQLFSGYWVSTRSYGFNTALEQSRNLSYSAYAATAITVANYGTNITSIFVCGNIYGYNSTNPTYACYWVLPILINSEGRVMIPDTTTTACTMLPCKYPAWVNAIALAKSAVYTCGWYDNGKQTIACYWKSTTLVDLPGDGVHDARAYACCIVR